MVEFSSEPRRIWFGPGKKTVASKWPSFAPWLLTRFVAQTAWTDAQKRAIGEAIRLSSAPDAHSDELKVAAETALKAGGFAPPLRHPLRLADFASEKAGDAAAVAAGHALARNEQGRVTIEAMSKAISSAIECAGWMADREAITSARAKAQCPAELMKLLEEARTEGELSAFEEISAKLASLD